MMTSAVTALLLCPRCPATEPTIAEMAAHLVEEHHLKTDVAARAARQAAQPAPPAAIVAPSESKESPMAKVCTACKRTDGTHTPGCRSRMKACKLCARRAPDKCPYHGGKPKVANGKRPPGGGQAIEQEAHRGA